MMTTRRTRRNAPLAKILRAGDPAADGRGPSPAEIARWRATLFHEAPAPRVARATLALAAAGPIVLLLAAIIAVRGSRPPAPPARLAGAEAPAARTIRMTAPGGTHIIWCVNPDREVAAPRKPSRRTGDQS